MNLSRRNKTFHIVRRVPKRYEAVEPRKVVWVSLHTDSESIARQKAPAAWSHMIEAWEARLHGDSDDAERQFEAARELAAVRGYRYLSADRVARLPRHELLERIEAIPRRGGKVDKTEAAALLGGAVDPSITVERALELYWEYAAEKAIGKSDDQIRRWKNPRIKAIANFVAVVGDKALAEITREDMLDFRKWWSDRLVTEGMTANSANKDIGYVESTLRLVEERKRLGLNLPFGKLTFSESDDDDRKRPPFSEGWIKTKILAPGALDKLNGEARAVVHAMVNTGMRPSEIVGLLPHHIRLDHDVPHIEIKAEGKQTKNKPSRRMIPLVGISLEAFRKFPGGFPSYRFKDKISDTVNKFLRENGLLETEEHTLYGLRHSFEDRMLAAKVDERIRRDLMGHSLAGRERYGDGGTLAHMRDMLQAIAL